MTAFDEADAVILHEIYSSARETSGSVTGYDLYRAIRRRVENVHFFKDILDAEPFCRGFLEPGDVFVTMGAGDNWRIGPVLLAGRGKGA